MQNKKGVSLIVLIITILVMIIIAGVVNLEDENPVAEASEAVFRQEITDLKEELKIVIFKKIVNKEIKSPKEANATTYNEIITYIPDFPKKYKDKFIIREGELFVVVENLTESERLWINKDNIITEYVK